MVSTETTRRSKRDLIPHVKVKQKYQKLKIKKETQKSIEKIILEKEASSEFLRKFMKIWYWEICERT